MNHAVIKKLGATVAVLSTLVLAACASQGAAVAESGQANTITVNSSSVVKVVPDKATFSVEVMAEGDTAEAAQGAATPIVNAVMAALREAGVDDKDIQTLYTNVTPTYNWASDEPEITGYEHHTTLNVTDVPVEQVAHLMDVCLAAGATGVGGPNYSATSYEDAYRQALAQAVEAAKPKAEAVAQAAGVKLAGVTSIVEGYQNTAYRYEEKALAADGMDAGADGMEIAPGEVSIEAQVTVTYAIN